MNVIVCGLNRKTMISAQKLARAFQEKGTSFFTGVPCSFFGDFLVVLASKHDGETVCHVAAPSEAEAMALAVGHYVTTGRIPVVYMQNSGLANAVDSLTSLTHRTVMSIPIVLCITWRGEPGIQDELHHKHMGAILLPLLDLLGIPYEHTPSTDQEVRETIARLYARARTDSQPVALIFRKNLIENGVCATLNPIVQDAVMTREQVLEILLQKTTNTLVFANLGKTARELYEIRERRCESHSSDLLITGAMGSVSGIGLGAALHTDKTVVILDGDSSLLMRLGTGPMIGQLKPKNLVHVVFDNGGNESTGNQPGSAPQMDWMNSLRAFAYRSVQELRSLEEVRALSIEELQKPAALIIKVDGGSRPSLGRPVLSPKENKRLFMDFLKKKDNG